LIIPQPKTEAECHEKYRGRGKSQEDFERRFLLDKDGKRIKKLSEAVCSEPDKNGTVYYVVGENDFAAGYNGSELTEEAKKKWTASLL